MADEDVNTIISFDDKTKDISISFFYFKNGEIRIERIPRGFVAASITSDLAEYVCMDDAKIAKYKLIGVIE